MQEWLDRLAAKTSTPGGGAVAAANGAIAAAQLKMIVEYTKQELSQIDLNLSIERYMEISAEDERAYEKVQTAFKSKVSQQIQKSLIDATEPSIKIINETEVIYEFIVNNYELFNKNLTADLVVVLTNLESALDGAAAMLIVNGKFIESMDYKSEIEENIGECDELHEKLSALKSVVRGKI